VKIELADVGDLFGLTAHQYIIFARNAAAITEGLVPWPRDFPASRELAHSRPNKNFGSQNFRDAPAKRNCELNRPRPVLQANIEFDTLRPAQIARRRAQDFPKAPANSEMNRLVAPLNTKSTLRAIHSTRSQLELRLLAPHHYAATASRTTKIPTNPFQQFPAEFPIESISIALTSAPSARQAGPTRKDPLRNADRFPSKYLFRRRNKGKRT
jgi:hypothetical protein